MRRKKTRGGLARCLSGFILVLLAAVCSGCASRPAIVCYGDSLTAGKGASAGEAYPALLGKRVKARVINAGVSGDTVAEALARVDADVLSYNPEMVIVELGANDFLEALNGKAGSLDPAALNNVVLQYKTILKKLCDGKRKIYIVKFYNREMAASFLNGNMTLFNAFELMFSSLAREYNAEIIDGIWEGIWGDPLLMSDDIHPNAAGYRIMADNYYAALKPYFAERGLLK